MVRHPDSVPCLRCRLPKWVHYSHEFLGPWANHISGSETPLSAHDRAKRLRSGEGASRRGTNHSPLSQPHDPLSCAHPYLQPSLHSPMARADSHHPLTDGNGRSVWGTVLYFNRKSVGSCDRFDPPGRERDGRTFSASLRRCSVDRPLRHHRPVHHLVRHSGRDFSSNRLATRIPRTANGPCQDIPFRTTNVGSRTDPPRERDAAVDPRSHCSDGFRHHVRPTSPLQKPHMGNRLTDSHGPRRRLLFLSFAVTKGAL